MMSAREPVAIVRCDSYESAAVDAAVRECLEHLGGMSRFVRPGMRVLLKPNLLAAREPDEAVTTHPAVVAAVARQVHEAGGQAVVADSPGGPFLAGLVRKVYAAAGMEAVARQTGARLNEDFTSTEVANPAGRILKRLRLITAVAGADLVINLPKLKTHSQMVYTGAVKNLFGTIAGTEKIEYHMRMSDYETFADVLIDVCLAARPALNILDAVVAMQGAGPSAGDPRQVGLLMGSASPFALDYAALRVVGVEPLRVPVIQAASRRGLGPSGPEDLVVAGRSIEEVGVRGFDVPALGQMVVVNWSQGRLLAWLAERIKPRPVFDHSLCTGCKACQASCPARVIEMAGGKPRVDLCGCIRCFCCQEMCPQKAITVRRLRPGLAAVLRIVYFLLSMVSVRRGRRTADRGTM